MISTIIFDHGEVLINCMKDMDIKLEQILGVPVPIKLYLEPEADYFFRGKLTEDEFWQKLI